MHSYKDFIKYFGISLFDPDFQAFLKSNFSDLTEYNAADRGNIVSENSRIEMGFQNNGALNEDEGIYLEEANPIFSTINIFLGSTIVELPFNLTFTDDRDEVFIKAGKPAQTNKGEASYFGPAYLVDNYKIEDIVVSIDYVPDKAVINFIQIRDNNLVEHLKI